MRTRGKRMKEKHTPQGTFESAYSFVCISCTEIFTFCFCSSGKFCIHNVYGLYVPCNYCVMSLKTDALLRFIALMSY